MKLRTYGSILLGLGVLGLGCGNADEWATPDGDETGYTEEDALINARSNGRMHSKKWLGAGGASAGGSAGADQGSGGTSSAGSAGAVGEGGTTGEGGATGQGGASGAPGTGGTTGSSFVAVATAVTSSSASLAWDASQSASSTRIFVGSEPAATPAGQLADQRLVATLDGAAASYELGGLAAATDVFVRVERDTQGGTVRDDMHVRTVGGPRAKLATPVRSVHTFGSRVLMVVLANGSNWQSAWTVTRADGSPIAVNSVKRHSIPVSAPQYTVGYGKPYSDTVLDVDHRIYLQLAEPLGNHDILRVKGPNGIDMTVPFSDRYMETPIIQLNQVGYNPRATERWAYISGWMGDGGAISFDGIGAGAEVLEDPSDTATPRTVALASAPITARWTADTFSGSDVRQINLASLPAREGARYRIRIPGIGVSWPTAVSEHAALKSFYVNARGMMYNRWGVELKMPWSQFQRGADHTQVYTADSTNWTGMYSESTPKTGQRTLIGGYHDAGDFDQRPMHTVVAETLLRAFEAHPSSYADGQLHIPESGNGIPDLLDEALWGVQGWEQLQESDGGVRNGAESYRHPWAFYHADTDPLTYWTWARSANVSARAAGLFAQAARLVEPYAPGRSAALEDRARKAFSYASANGASAAFKLYGASELYRLTGEASYKSAFESAWTSMGTYGAFSKFANEALYMGDYTGSGRAVANYLLGYVQTPGASSSIVSTTQSWFTKLADEVTNTLQNARAHRHPAGASRPQDWGNASTTGKYVETIIARLQLGGLSADQQQKYFNALSLAADWALGGNPNGYVYITGLGSRKVEEPLHLDSLAYFKEGKGVMPGFPVYGPIDGAPGTSYTQATVATFYPSFNSQPKGLRYGDVRTLVTCNEFTIWESQAPHTELFAVLMGPQLMPPASWAPGQSEHLSPLP